MARAEGPGRGLQERRAALALILDVRERRRPLPGPGGETEGNGAAGGGDPLAGLPPEGRARALRLARSGLRHAGRADRLLGPHLRRPPPAAVHAALHLALAEHFAEGVPAHAAVSAAVTLAAEAGGPALAGLANAVLRRVLAAGPEAWAAAAPGKLPAWLRRRLVAAWGGAAVAAMEAAHEAGAPLDLTPREPEAAAALAARLGAELLPTGSLRLRGTAQVSALPGYAGGEWWVQDAAAAIPARVLAPRRGERVLDLCAAPGGKTLQLCAAGARVTALDASAPRLARLRANLARTGLAAEVVQADALAWRAPAPFPALLLDAPCSATGTIRRHPDLPHVKDGSELPALLALQARLLDRALELVAPGGRLVYATCSLLPEEGEGQIAAALARHPGLRTLPEALALPGIAPEWITPEGGLRLRPDFWPERGGMDGFFIACLVREG